MLVDAFAYKQAASVAHQGKIGQHMGVLSAALLWSEGKEVRVRAGANGTNARQVRMERSPPLGASPCKRPRTQLHYRPRQRSRLGEPATALGLSWDTAAGAGGALSVMQDSKRKVRQCLAHCLASYHTK